MTPPSGLTGRLSQPQPVARPNRLSRRFRPAQPAQKAASPQSDPADFKTPTRVLRSRAGAGFNGESPNDSDVQQDIIWDATSPSPCRYGKRGKKQRAGRVDISEIVSRIAPEHGRPVVAEPTLQQWIGDSATIPCTPDVQVPKAKRKSLRPNGVDDLLKLARQFDLNMFHQEDEDEEEEAEGGAEDRHQQFPEILPDDDLDFVFDALTQHVTGGLSQTPDAGSSKEASGKVSASGVVTATKRDELEDDWENDDLLDDSLLLEMTQNPLKFVAPKYCSTQKPSGETRRQSPAKVPVGGELGQSAASKAIRDNARQRTTFKLESNPDFTVKGILTETWTNVQSDARDGQQSRFSSVKEGSQPTWQPPNSQRRFPPPARGAAAKPIAASAPQRFPSHGETAASSDLPDADLLAFFSPDPAWDDPVWDDPADDDLLCEICDDLENRIQGAENICPKPTALQAASRQAASRQAASRKASSQTVPPRPSGRPLAKSCGSTNGSVYVQGNAGRNQFAFETPRDLVTTATSKVPGKCSAAEIERKKQQAMERRRQRLQATQNPRAPP